MIYKFQEVVTKKDGFLRGPFGSSLKKTLFVPKGNNTYKVYEQCVPLEQNEELGRYYISKEYFDESMFRFETKPKDFLVSCSGVNYGAIYQLSDHAEKGIINQALLRIRLNNEIIDDNYFLFLFKCLILRKITSGTGDSTIPNFPSMDVVKNIEFDLPSLSVQKKIGETFKNIENKIKNNNKIINELESMAKTLYDYWFLQFEFPNEEGRPYKSSGGKMVYNEELKREIPKGWKVINVKKHCKITWGQCPDGENILPLNTDQDSMLYCSGAGDMRNGLLVDCQARTNASRRIANANDILMSVAGSIGAICFCDKTISLGRAAVAFSPNRNEELFTLMSVKSFSDRMKTVSSGSIQKVVNDNHLDDMNLVLDDEVLAKFSKYNSLLDEMVNLCIENRELASLRDFLLPMLMNGQVTFK